MKDIRTGNGFDVHRLTEGRRCIICGVDIPHRTGLLGHSDADVALHALCDAILGALALGDIGKHFPDSDPRYKGIDSKILLGHVMDMVRGHGYELSNADITIAAQKPKLASYIPEMRRMLADVMHVDIDRVSVKATTTERLGFEGREEGISATSVCLLQKV